MAIDRTRLLGTAWIVTVFLAVLALSASLFGPPGHGDSGVFHTGAVLCGPHLYQYDLQSKLQVPGDLSPYFRAPFYALALRVLLHFPFAVAWYILNLLAAALFVVLVPFAFGKDYPWKLTVLAVVFLPLIGNFAVEQDGALVLLVLTVALLLHRRGYPLLAGVVLALTVEKPTLFLLLPVILLCRKSWRMLAGYVSTGLALAVISLGIVGFGAIPDYIDLVGRFPLVLYKMPTARGVAAGLHLPFLWIPISVAVTVAVIWAARKTNFESAFCLGLAASLFISPQSYNHDLTVLLLPILYFAGRKSGIARWAGAVFLFPPTTFVILLPQPWVALNGLLVLAYLVAIILGIVRPSWGNLRWLETRLAGTQPVRVAALQTLETNTPAAR